MRQRDELGAHLAGDGAGHERLAAAGRAVEQQAAAQRLAVAAGAARGCASGPGRRASRRCLTSSMPPTSASRTEEVSTSKRAVVLALDRVGIAVGAHEARRYDVGKLFFVSLPIHGRRRAAKALARHQRLGRFIRRVLLQRLRRVTDRLRVVAVGQHSSARCSRSGRSSGRACSAAWRLAMSGSVIASKYDE